MRAIGISMLVKCEAGHKIHKRKTVSTVLGKVKIYDWDLYKDFSGYCTGQDDVSRTIDLYGTWESAEMMAAKRILTVGDRRSVFVDVGSHIGWYSKLAGGYGYRSMAYEGDAENIQLWKQNVGQTTVAHLWFDEHTPKIIGLPPIELLKIDIEGNEQYAIEALSDCLPRTKNILMEVSPVFNDSYPALVEKIESQGFIAKNLDGSSFNHKYNFEQTNLLFTR